jgi:predicted permease
MAWLARFLNVFRSKKVSDEIEREVAFHLAERTDDLVAGGMSPAAASREARRRFGNPTLQMERTRERDVAVRVETLWADIRYGVRGLRKSPGFSTVAILSLALGVGANTTIFTYVNAALLRPLPYPESDRLVILRERALASSVTVNVHPLNFMEWRARAHSFEALALVQSPPLNVIGANGPEQIYRVQVTSDLFRVFGVILALGRGFTDEEMRPGHHEIVILGHGFWLRWFGGDPGVIGRTVAIPEGSLTIVGVAAPSMRIGATEPDAYTPLRIDPANPGAIGSRSFECYGRLRRGVTVAAARAEMAVISAALAREYPLDQGMGSFVSGLQDYLVRDMRPALRLLMAVVATVLLIACVNLGGLLIARGVSRRGEFALRASLGASRGRLVRQMLIESAVLATLGGAAGLVLAYCATRALVSLTAGILTTATIGIVSLDRWCLVFTLVVSASAALAFGFVPAWQASLIEPHVALGELSRRGTADRRQHRLRSVLVISEVALAVVLLVGGTLLLRTFSHLTRLNLGFEPARTLTMRLFLGAGPPEGRVALVDRILDNVEALPGVKAAGTIQFLPLTGVNCGTGVWLEEIHRGDRARAVPTDCSLISRGYFAAMGIPVLSGRPFDQRDRPATPRVLVVNQSFARRYFAGGRVLGRRILVDGTGQMPAEIIGVVGDIRHNALTSDPTPTVFLLHAQTPGYITSLVVRTAGDPAAAATAVRAAIHDADPAQAVAAVKTMEEYRGELLARPRLYSALVAAFAILAATLAAIGLYGLIAYLVTLRSREIGIRLALGAARQTVFLALVREGSRLVVAGLVVGLGTAAALRGILSTLMFGVTPGDPVSYVSAGAAFAVVALAAASIPASRAARVDPMAALRHE